MSSGKLYGVDIPDQVDRIAALSDAQLGLLSDIREIYKERAVLEKEYSTKLAILAKKAADKKAKRMASLVVGDDPSVAWGEDTVRLSTLDKAYDQLVSSLDSTAQDHSSLSDALISQVADGTKTLEKKHEDMKTKQYQFYQKLLSERDKVYAERQKANKAKGLIKATVRILSDRLDTPVRRGMLGDRILSQEAVYPCQDRSTDDRHTSRAAKQFEAQKIDMQNSKNTYLITTAIANRSKNRFYQEDLPLIENDFQRLQANLIAGLVSILLQAQQIHTSHLTTLQNRVNATREAIENVNPTPDQDLYITYNTRAFSVPNDWGWEPCTGYYDTGEMVVEPEPKVVLQNKLSRCRERLDEVNGLINFKKKDVDKLSNIVSTYMNNRNLGSVDDIMNDYLGVQHQLMLLEFSATVLSAEIDVICAALGGDEGLQSPHNFKSTSFSIPTTCGYCKSSIWGLTKQGKTCRTCGLCVHAKCELKVPANCGGGGERPVRSLNSTIRGGDISRADSRASTISQASVSSVQSPSSFSRPHAVAEESYPQARVLYGFTPSSPFELAVTDGETVQVIEDDDGSGWVKVANSHGGKGLVPASYIQIIEGKTAPPIPATTKPKTRGSGKYVRGIYSYQAAGPDEISIEEDGMYELSAGAGGGTNYADGWWEGYDASGRKGIFPSNYVQLV